MSSRWTLLSLILLFSLVLNTWGIGWGLPERWHPDELTQRAENMVGEPSLNPHYFAYGAFHYYVIAAVAVLPVKVPNKMFHLVDYDAQSTLVVMLSRLVSAVMATAIVLLIYLLGERLFDRRTGYIAAAMLAFSMLLVNLAHFATVDVPSLFWFTLSCVFAVRILRDPSSRSYVLAGLCAGLSAAVKYVGGIALAVVLVAHLLGRRTRHGYVAAAVLSAMLAFVVGNPTLLFAPLEFADGFVSESVFNSLRGEGLSRAFVPLVLQLWDGVGAPLFLLALIGLVYGFFLLSQEKERPAVLLVLTMLIPYYLVIGSMRGPRAGPLLLPLPPLRYSLPLLPFLLLLAAKLISDLVASPRAPLRAGAHVVCAGTLAYSLLYSAGADLKFTHDSRYTAHAWLLDHLAPGSTIETTSYGPVIPANRYQVSERPHDNGVADVASSMSQNERYREFQTMMGSLEGWLEHAGLRTAGPRYVPWHRRALLEYDQQAATFDRSIQGLESRGPDVLLVSDLYFTRFNDGSSTERRFFEDLFAGRSTYARVSEFQYRLPAWLDPPAEFVNPKIYAYARRAATS